jgi:RNA polymerase sigma-70 factor (ECF subfamily)
MALFKHRYKKLSDEKLMEFIQRGDTSAFDELYDRYSRRLLLYFSRELGGSEEKAQDFLQDIFLKIVEKPGLFDTERRFSAWLFTVAYNMCKNEYRRLEVREDFRNNVTADTPARHHEGQHSQIEQHIDRGRFQEALSEELERLDNGHRSAFLLRHQENLSIKEISEVLGCSEGTVKSRLFYTTRKLASRLRAFNPYLTEVHTNGKSK